MVVRASISVAVDVRLGHAQAIQRIRLVLAGVEDRRIGQLVLEEALQVVPGTARRLLAVGQNAALGVFGEQREIQALDGLAAFVGQLGADAAFVFEAGDFVAAGATIELHQRLALVLELGIVHEVGGIVVRVGVLQRDQVAGHVARVFDR